MNFCPSKILSLVRHPFRNKWHTCFWRWLLFIRPQVLTLRDHVDTVLHTFNKPAMSTYYVPSTVVGPWDINTKQVLVPYLRMLMSTGRKMDTLTKSWNSLRQAAIIELCRGNPAAIQVNPTWCRHGAGRGRVVEEWEESSQAEER